MTPLWTSGPEVGIYKRKKILKLFFLVNSVDFTFFLETCLFILGERMVSYIHYHKLAFFLGGVLGRAYFLS